MASIKDKVTLARLEERMISMGQTLTKIETLLAVQNGRITKLESWKNKAIGISIGVSTVVSALIKKVF